MLPFPFLLCRSSRLCFFTTHFLPFPSFLLRIRNSKSFTSSSNSCSKSIQLKLLEIKKVVLKLEVNDDKCKQKAMKTVSSLSGLESLSMDMKDKKLTVTGDVDPVEIVKKLRKMCFTDIVSIGPAKEPEKKKEEPKKEEPKKEEAKKAEEKKDPVVGV